METQLKLPADLIAARGELAKHEIAARQLESEEKYRALFNSIDEGFCICEMIFDNDGAPTDYRFLEVNPTFEQHTGLFNAAGKTAREMIPDLEAHWFELYGKVVETGEPARFVNGSTAMNRWFDVYAVRVGAADSRKFAVIFKDITEQKRRDDALRESDARLRLAIDISRTSTFEIDLLTDAVETDEIGREIYGFEKDEPLTFAKIQARFHPDDRDRVIAAVARAFEPEGSHEFAVEQRIVRADNEIRWIRVRGRAFFADETNEKRAVRCIGTYIDITDSKLFDQTLRDSRQLNQDVLDSLTAHIAVLNRSGEIALVNRAWRDFAIENGGDASDNAIMGVNYLKTCAQADDHESKEIYRGIKAVLNGASKFFSIEYPCHSTIAQRWFLLTISPLTGAHGGAVVSHYNITKRKIAEIERERFLASEQEARRAAEEASRLKDEFLATVSHELRTPLNAILGWANLLRSGNLDDKAAARAFETIERNARAQAQLIEDLLDVSRIITGNLRLDVRAVSPESFIEAALEAVRPAAESKGVQLLKIIDPNAPKVSGDATRLQQIVWNLLSNAVKFTARGGSVTISLTSRDSAIEISVSDTGEGIEPDFLPFVFDRFRQADGTTTRKHGGLGLGLAIVRQLVELHGGAVSAASAGAGAGSTFTVKLPIAPIFRQNEDLNGEQRRAAADHDSPVLSAAAERLDAIEILIVDDESDARELLATVLRERGARVKIAASVAEAFERLHRAAALPDVIVSDIQMPEADGYELIKKLRALPAARGGKIPAIALTAHARAADRLQALRAGYQMHIAKPIELNELVAVVASLVERSKN